VFAVRYKVVVDLHAKFAGLCKAVEEEGQVGVATFNPKSKVSKPNPLFRYKTLCGS
jgi:hypothetical protein